MQRTWVLAFVAACGGSKQAATTPPPPPPPSAQHTCAKAADHMIDTLPAEAKSAPPEQLKALKDDIVGHCTTDKWSTDVMACVENATKTDDIAKCDELLTPAQRDSLANDSAGAAPPPPDAKKKDTTRGPKKGGDPEEGGE